MAQVSSVVTGGVTISAATMVPLVSWGLTGFAHPVPPDVPGLLAALLLTGIHAVYNYLQARKEITSA